jgi:TRAP-type C4-dicarboxylate transport system permease small subunit
MRKTLDWIYRVSGVAAILLLISIAALTLAQIAARLAGTIVPSADDFATFAMAASIFLGLTYTYRIGGHVRVRSLHQYVRAGARRWMEIGSLATIALTLVWLLWYAIDMIVSSYRLNEHTLGLVPIPTWIPMSFMPVGMVVLLLAVSDDLVAVLFHRQPSYAAREDAEMPTVGAE